MRLCLISDLHVDIPGQHPLPEMAGDVLIVAGDVSNSLKKTTRTIRELAQDFSYTLFVDGNHEHYSNLGHNPPITVAEASCKIRELIPEHNIHYLPDMLPLDIDQYRIIGVNGWYSFDWDRPAEQNIEFWARYMNDYRCTWKGINQKLPYELAKANADYLDIQIEKAVNDQRKIIVVTHTIPHADLLWRKPWDPGWERAHAFFLNSHMQKLAEKYGDQIFIWHFGHTHCTLYKEINGIRFICNPRGYPGENPSWAPIYLDI